MAGKTNVKEDKLTKKLFLFLKDGEPLFAKFTFAFHTLRQ